ncbi:SUKH-4 family immunity protein [Priestia sp. RMT2NF4]|uniref:SUKH-4 family immunity protein n=1 Tax=Priestia sp. RMT2NF4 TaxID=3398394 RepID=UPI003A4C554E
MISPQDFLDNWNKDIYGLVNYDEKIINSLPLSQETKDFLIEAGFPESSPPFLTFESAVSGGGERLIEKNNKLETTYHKFLYFGFTGSGYPICIDESNSELVYIDYDNDNKVVLINTTIAKFAEALLVYVEFIKKVKAVNGRRAYLEKNATKDLLDWISGQLQKIDAASLTKGCFWEEELGSFIE